MNEYNEVIIRVDSDKTLGSYKTDKDFVMSKKTNTAKPNKTSV